MEPITKTINTVDWITIILFTSVLFIAIAKSLFYSRFLNFIILPFNNKYIFMYNKKDKLLNWFHVFLTLFQLLNYSLFLYLAGDVLFDFQNQAYPYFYPVILGSIILFLLLKILLQMGNGFVFNNGKVISEFIFKKLSYFNYSALVAFLANIILTYVFKDSNAVVFTSLYLHKPQSL